MKKDKKFLFDLENELKYLNKKDKTKIIEKYSNIIKNRLSNKEKIKVIINDLGDPKVIAEKEKQIIKNNKKLYKIIKKIKVIFLNFIKKIFNSVKNIKVNFKKQFNKKHKNIKNNKKFNNDIKNKNLTVKTKDNKYINFNNNKKNNIIYIILESIILIIMLLLWLYINVILIASVFAFLDGVKLYGITISLFGIGVLVFWIIISFLKIIFKRGKSSLKLTIIITMLSIFLIAFGISLTILKLYKIDNINDVSQKYSMSINIEKYFLPRDGKKMYIVFNSNYDTQYIINYDENLNGQFKLEVDYYECYYDYFVKKTTNNIYISLKKDKKDIISAFIDDLKENKIYDSDELSRYIVKITISKKDYERLVIQN